MLQDCKLLLLYHFDALLMFTYSFEKLQLFEYMNNIQNRHRYVALFPQEEQMPAKKIQKNPKLSQQNDKATNSPPVVYPELASTGSTSTCMEIDPSDSGSDTKLYGAFLVPMSRLCRLRVVKSMLIQDRQISLSTVHLGIV